MAARRMEVTGETFGFPRSFIGEPRAQRGNLGFPLFVRRVVRVVERSPDRPKDGRLRRETLGFPLFVHLRVIALRPQ